MNFTPSDAQLARARETISSVIEEWRLSYRIGWHKTHGDLESLMVAGLLAMHMNGTITINEPRGAEGGA